MRLVVLCRLVFLLPSWVPLPSPPPLGVPLKKTVYFVRPRYPRAPVSLLTCGVRCFPFFFFLIFPPSSFPSAAPSLSALSAFSLLSPFLPWPPLFGRRACPAGRELRLKFPPGLGPCCVNAANRMRASASFGATRGGKGFRADSRPSPRSAT